LDDKAKLDIMPGTYLHELWKYHKRVQDVLKSDLTEFKETCGSARGTIKGLRCDEYSSHRIPSWLDQYIESIVEAPHLFDFVEFNTAMARHLDMGGKKLCECASIPSQTIHKFWEALASVVNHSFEEVSIIGVLPSCSGC
jgi:hypothetical protein